MNTLLNDLLGLNALRFGDGHAGFGWAHPIPAWGWLLIVGGAAGAAAWSYARLEGPRRARIALAFVRATLLVLLAAAAAGPRLERARTEVERDRVAILVDRSASLTVADTPGQSRDDRLRALIATASPTWTALALDKDVDWLAFDHGAAPMTPGPGGAPDLPPADGERTAIGAAIDEALRRAAGRPLSGLVVISDGRSADRVSASALRALQTDRIPLHVVPLGSSAPGADLAILSVEAPGVAFVDDTVPVNVRFETQGVDPTTGWIEIIDDASGIVLESRAVTPDEAAEGRATIPVTTEAAGEQRWTARFVSQTADLSPANDAAALTVRLVDEPIRVLYVDGSPRWEHRFLKSLLLREDSIDASCLLLAVNRRFQQEGDTLLASLPVGEDEWSEFDVVIIGDVRPELLGRRALDDIRALVGDGATGLLWLAGPGATPAAWGDTPLTDLIPLAVSTDSASGAPAAWPGPVVLKPTPLAERSGVFAGLSAGDGPGGVSDPAAGWSALRWALRITPDALKASAETLAVAVPVDTAEAAAPLVVSMRYGAGRVALVGTDEIWRWRYGRGEGPTERFWLPLIRSLARARLAEIGAAASLEASPAIAELGGRISVRLTITDQSIAEIAPAEIRAAVRRAGRGEGGAGPVETASVRLSRDHGARAGRTVYTGSMPALRAGSFTIVVPPDTLSGVTVETRLEVVSPDDERRNPQADHAFLTDLADQTGGRVLAPDRIASLTGLLPNRRVILPLEPEISTLWDKPFVLAVLIVLLTAEWVGRRLIRLT